MSIHSKRFPNESKAYRAARDELLEAEIELRSRLAEVAAKRQALPLGGLIPEDYVFDALGDDGEAVPVRLSETFAPGKDSLVIYSFMFDPEWKTPCTSCNSILDGLNGSARHYQDRVNFVAVAKVGVAQFQSWGDGRHWNNLKLLSSRNNDYNVDYHAENDEGNQIPACNVFVRRDDGIHHFWSAELLYAPLDGHPRHVDLLWPVWNVLDLTPEGRGEDWEPKHSYS